MGPLHTVKELFCEIHRPDWLDDQDAAVIQVLYFQISSKQQLFLFIMKSNRQRLAFIYLRNQSLYVSELKNLDKMD